MIVDDDAELAELLRESIMDAGFRPIWARNGREALSAITHEKPAMVLLDIEMPEMDGIELLAKLDRAPGLARIPRAVLTGTSRRVQRASTACPIVRKPFHLERLLRLIRDCVNGDGGGHGPLCAIPAADRPGPHLAR